MVKLCIGHKSGKTKQIETDTKPLVGKKLGETFKGEVIDMAGYEFQITGGSDASGFPMRLDVDSSAKKKVLIVSGTGLKKPKRPGLRTRKTVAGNTVTAKTAQLNLKIIKEGKQSLFEEPKEEAAEGEAKDGEAPAEEKKE